VDFSKCETLQVVNEDGIVTLTINRPKLRNALSKETVDEIRQTLQKLADNTDIRVVIFTGAGEKSFAAGADIGQLRDRTIHDGLVGRMQTLCYEIEQFTLPTIAAINGFALGGGCELAMACDIRIASDNAKLGLPELNLSIIPGAGGTQRLARLVGKGKALELILTGKIIDAYKAEQIGLVSQVVPGNRLMKEAENMAKMIMSKGPLAVRLAKMSIHAGFETNIQTGLLIEKLAQTVLYTTEDKIEGATAFLEKRAPQFRGN
jgi:enoyl-CoA hydratase/carnithine racemase